MKIGILTNRERVEQFYDLSTLPQDWQLIFAGETKTEEEVLQLLPDADALFADVIRPISRRLIMALPSLKLIQSEGVGYNKFDLAAATERGIYVCNNAAGNSGAVAEQTILLMLALLRRLQEGDTLERQGKQIIAKTQFILDGIYELQACRVGLIGFGAIGQEVAKRLQAFGCSVAYYCRQPLPQAKSYGAVYTPLPELLQQSHIISLHLPVTPETQNFLDAAKLQQMRQGAILINTARGEVMDQQAVAAALKSGTLAAAGFDTLAPEPVPADHPLLQLPEHLRYRVLFSPHIGGTTYQAFAGMHRHAWQNMLAISRGERPTNIVNGEMLKSPKE